MVLTDKRNSTKSGKALETLGSFNAQNDKERNLDTERIKYWLSKGAQLSGTLHNYLIEQKIITGKKINVLPKKRPIKSEVKETKEEKPLGGEASKSPEEASPPTLAPAEAVA